ncbi:hypothetical protein SASPL_127788 [Salvia splendens]|uniref:Uncharacterized protein n=1 Tax=Salvia splendens TaxID=180675 RepID=A0A8X8X9U2_SALSN|nr:hypothetical protein SASPL_127788 [Salvia splendens]
MAAAILSCSNFPLIKLHFSSPSHSIPRASRFRGKTQLSSLPHMTISGVSNSQYGRVWEGSGSGKIYRRLGSCLVIPPPAGRKPKALIKFLGGAFIGAVPEVTYSYLMELLAEEGYLIISVPYNVSFDHEQVTREIYERFHACLNSILSTGLPDNGISATDIADLPYYSVGHSNGALLQVLTGSYFCEKIPKVVLLGPVVKQIMPAIETSPVYSVAQSVTVILDFYNFIDGWKMLIDVAERVLPGYDPEATVSLTKFVDQLPSVFSQVAQGTSEFKPSPAENLDCLNKLYNIQHTLLVKFETDPIDETDLLEETLKPRVESFGGKVEKVVLRGTHMTPCIQEPRWEVGAVYTPADAIAQGLKAISLNEIRALSRTITNFFCSLQ